MVGVNDSMTTESNYTNSLVDVVVEVIAYLCKPQTIGLVGVPDT